MATKSEKKDIIRTQIIEAAKIYGTDLAGRTYLYVYGNEFFEVSFFTDRFLHLTGVDSNLSAKGFYKKAKEGKLTTTQFFFSQKHPYANAKKKLPCLKRLPELTQDYVCIISNLPTPTITYKLGVTNLEFTVGFTENTDKKGNKINDYYLPRTLRVNDSAVEKSADGEVVDFIFEKDASVTCYEKCVVADSNKKVPEQIRHLVDAKFYEDKSNED